MRKRNVTMNEKDAELERKADWLLARAGKDPEYPAYSERGLKRRVRAFEVSLETLQEEIQDDGNLSQMDMQNWVSRDLESSDLSKLDLLVLSLRKIGCTHREIAERLGISHQTVNFHLKNCRKIMKRSVERSPFAGLPHVYWQEVHRFVYRKPAHSGWIRKSKVTA